MSFDPQAAYEKYGLKIVTVLNEAIEDIGIPETHSLFTAFFIHWLEYCPDRRSKKQLIIDLSEHLRRMEQTH